MLRPPGFQQRETARRIKAALDRPLVLIGLMGAGKTRMGGLLGKALGLPFIDADREIEAAAGMTIGDIFAEYGEPAFRDLERRVIRRLLDGERLVLATGGGAVMQPETAELIQEKALTVWLKADLDTLTERTGRNERRPLLKGRDARGVLEELMTARYPVYEKAALHVDSHGTPKDTLNRLLGALEEYYARA